jgi:hypothetical protein
MTCVLGLLPALVRAQTATFSGTVLSDPDERRLANVEVALPQIGKGVRTDSAGNFLIVGIPAGSYAVIARLVGFATTTATVVFQAGEKVEADLMMTAVPKKLDTVKVQEKLADLRLRDFEERRSTGVGRFLTTDVFEKNRDRQFAELLIGSITGLRAVGSTNEKFIAAGRGQMSAGPCYVQVVLDGVFIYVGREGTPLFDVNTLNTADVLGVEYYTPATTPPRFNITGGGGGKGASGAACGTLVIWRK